MRRLAAWIWIWIRSARYHRRYHSRVTPLLISLGVIGQHIPPCLHSSLPAIVAAAVVVVVLAKAILRLPHSHLPPRSSILASANAVLGSQLGTGKVAALNILVSSLNVALDNCNPLGPAAAYLYPVALGCPALPIA
jgi:hypothetical protein